MVFSGLCLRLGLKDNVQSSLVSERFYFYLREAKYVARITGHLSAIPWNEKSMDGMVVEKCDEGTGDRFDSPVKRNS